MKTTIRQTTKALTLIKYKAKMDRTSLLKKNIRHAVDKVQDTNVLEAVFLLLEREARYETEMLSPMYVPSVAEQSAIEEGYRQSEAGETLPHDQVRAEMEKKYKL